MVSFSNMWQFALLLATAWLTNAADLPPSCSRPVYCDSKLLHHVQLARLYDDSKTFVDLDMNYDENKTLTDFEQLLSETNDNPSKEQLKEFVEKYFTSETVLEEWIPTDFNTDPEFVDAIKDKELRQFGVDINNIWPIISRKVKDEFFQKTGQTSLIPITNGFIAPGGRFQEIYYWDTYWIVEGLLISGMYETTKGVIENLIQLLNQLGHIPNASRWYYQERSQPPLLSAMMAIYYKYTNDIQFLRDNIAALEKEVAYFLDNKFVTIEKDNANYTLLRYYAPSLGPRPESYREDYLDAQKLNENVQNDFYIDIKSAAESGWDFSARWFITSDGGRNGSLIDIQTTNIVPVDLNAIFTGVLQNTADFNALLGNTEKAAYYAQLAKEFREAIQAVLWNDDEGIWFDYNIRDNTHRKYFYTSNFAPLWQGAVTEENVKANGPKVVRYIQESGALEFPGGVPNSLDNTGEQWDYPNMWAPEVSIVVNALQAINSEESGKLAVEVAQKFVRTTLKGYNLHKQMFEKYNVEKVGEYGGGGEYVVQIGFGMTNGAVLDFLTRYGDVMTAEDSPNNSSKN